MDPYAELCRLRSTLEAFAAIRLVRHPRRKEIFQRLLFAWQPWNNAQNAATTRHFIARTSLCTGRWCNPARYRPCWRAGRRVCAVSMRNCSTSERRTGQASWPSIASISISSGPGLRDPVVVEQATHLHLEVGWYRKAVSEGRRPVAGSEVDRVASFLSIHHASEIDISEVAQNVAFLSPSQLTRRFHAQFGMAPYAWLRQVRLDRAKTSFAVQP